MTLFPPVGPNSRLAVSKVTMGRNFSWQDTVHRLDFGFADAVAFSAPVGQAEGPQPKVVSTRRGLLELIIVVMDGLD